MASELDELKEALTNLKSPVWEHFGFTIKYEDANKRVNKPNAVCRHCRTAVRYVLGNTSNMLTHLKRHHPSLNVTGMTTKGSLVQTTMSTSFKKKESFPDHSARAKEITNAIGVFIAADLRPYSVVENRGSKQMMKVIEPGFKIPSRPYMSEVVIPSLYNQVKATVVHELSNATSVALTTDGWTSRTTEGFLTVTAQHITSECEIKSHVLQTRPIYDQHTSTNLAEVLKATVVE